MNPIITITMRHCHKAKLCSRGVNAWFKQHKLDYMTFLRDGCPSNVIEATGDALGLYVVDVARKEQQEGGM